MQTILGSGGAIGTQLAKILPEFTDKVRLVSRNPEIINAGDELFSADLLDEEATREAVKGSNIVYLTVGLKYNTATWEAQWPKIMLNVLNACTEHDARLVFFDNIYMYDPAGMHNITEDSTVNPTSKKGKVRAEIAGMLLDAHKAGKIKGLIARCADFYGPQIRETSMLAETVIKPLKAGKKANWLGGLKYQHSFTFTPDAALATAMLGNSETSYGQVWHLPTASDPPTGREWVELIARELDIKPSVQAAPKFLVQLIGLFNPIMKEVSEMMYQYDRNYIFNSDKFNREFNFKPTSYTRGIRKTINPL